MGYEVRLLIGETGTCSKKVACGDLAIEDGEAYRPYLKDESGDFIYTNVDETYFMIAAQINMCKIGNSELCKALKKNTNELHEYYWYGSDGNTRISEDSYGDKPAPSTIQECINALKKDIETSEYRRFKWALSLLESMKDSGMVVLWQGY